MFWGEKGGVGEEVGGEGKVLTQLWRDGRYRL